MNRFNRDDFEDESENEPKKKRFNIFNRVFADGKGVEKDELRVLEDPSLINFFKLFGRKLYFVFQGAAPEQWMLEAGEYTMKRFAAHYGLSYGGMMTNRDEAAKLTKTV